MKYQASLVFHYTSSLLIFTSWRPLGDNYYEKARYDTQHSLGPILSSLSPGPGLYSLRPHVKMPDIVYLKEAHGYSTKTELTVSATVEEMLVSDLKAAVEKKMGIPVDDQSVFLDSCLFVYIHTSLSHHALMHCTFISAIVCRACIETWKKTATLCNS